MDVLEIGLSFLEGIGLIISPCILPVLPLVLSASVDGGRRRPYGIITGFVLAFSLFVLGSRWIVNVLNIDLDYIKYGSLVLLFLFGLVLLSEKLSAVFSKLTQGAADFGSRVGAGSEGGFVSGVSIGALIGLVWTPCAGPILAAVLVQVIRQQTSAQGVLVTLAFALGAGVPMLLITLLGRQVMGRLKFFTTHAEVVRKIFGVLILVAVALMASGVAAAFFAGGGAPAEQVENSVPQDGLQDGLSNPYPAPEFTGIDNWLNSPKLTMKDLRGKAVLVDFWTYSCINCVRTLPYLTSWDQKYRDKGLVIVGVHAPEFEFEKKIGNIKTALEKYGITYPVAVDNNLATWGVFKNKYWPAHYLIDKNGQVVYTHFGEGKYDVTENNIRYLLGLGGKAEAVTGVAEFGPELTPETYLGAARNERFDGKPKLTDNKPVDYGSPYPESLRRNHWALSGIWKAETQKSIAQEKGAALHLHFKAAKVFLVMGTASGAPAKVSVNLRGEARYDVTVSGHALYTLVDEKEVRDGILSVTAQEPGLEVYAFTFGR